MQYLFTGRGLVRIEGGMLEPVAVVQVVLVEQQSIGVEVL
jgi:hypothetical protein